MRLCDALKEKEMDVRLRDRHVAEGSLSGKDVERYLKSLADDASNCIELDDKEGAAQGTESQQQPTE